MIDSTTSIETGKKFALFDYKDKNGINEIKAWSKKLQKSDLAKLNVRLDMLSSKGLDLLPQILTGTDTSGILKLRVHGKVQLRPMLCKGPINNETEFTLLIGATERDSCLIPDKADAKANDRKNIIITDHTRRCCHERVS
jgi:hypothetical protein